MTAAHPALGEFVFACDGNVPLLFTENETNHERLFPGQKNESAYVKDGINDCVVDGRQDAVNPGRQGTKVAAHYKVTVGAGQSEVIRVRLSSASPNQRPLFGKSFDDVFAARRREADEFYKSVTPPSVSEDAANVMRQAIAGMLWSKQFFFFDGDNWLDEHNSNPLHHGYRDCPELGVVPHAEPGHHLHARQVGVPLVRGLGPGLPHAAAGGRRPRLCQAAARDDAPPGSYLHPNGQIPAYEWNFSDVNPPVHAWATLFLTRTEKALRGEDPHRLPEVVLP